MRDDSDLELATSSVDFDTLATLEDVRACFRLLLGRNPSREEWVGHSTHVGSPLEAVVKNYMSSLEFRSRGMTDVDDRLTEISIADRRVFVYADDLGPSAMMMAGSYEPGVTGVLGRLLTPTSFFVDVGANVGYYTMIAAGIATAGLVIAVEPSVRNVRAIRAGAEANGFSNIVIRNVAATTDWQLMAFGSTGSNGSVGQLDGEGGSVDIVQGVPLDVSLAGLDRLDLVKIDIEGAEMIALQGAERTLSRFHPTIVSEFAPPAIGAVSGVSGEDYLELLLRHGYELSVVLHDGEVTPPSRTVDAIMSKFEAARSDHIDILAT